MTVSSIAQAPVDFFGGSMVKNLPANAEDVVLILGLGRSPEEGNGNPFPIFALKIPWRAEPGSVIEKDLDMT